MLLLVWPMTQGILPLQSICIESPPNKPSVVESIILEQILVILLSTTNVVVFPLTIPLMIIVYDNALGELSNKWHRLVIFSFPNGRGIVLLHIINAHLFACTQLPNLLNATICRPHWPHL